MIALPFHTMELIKPLRHPRAVHAMYKQVPVFHARIQNGSVNKL